MANQTELFAAAAEIIEENPTVLIDTCARDLVLRILRQGDFKGATAGQVEVVDVFCARMALTLDGYAADVLRNAAYKARKNLASRKHRASKKEGLRPVVAKGGKIEWVRDDAGYRSYLRSGDIVKGSGPCAPIAVATVTGTDLLEVIAELAPHQAEAFAETNRKLVAMGYNKIRARKVTSGCKDEVWEAFMERRGFVCIRFSRRITWSRFEKTGVASVAPDACVRTHRHLTALKGGALHDAWDCRKNGRAHVLWICVPTDREEAVRAALGDVARPKAGTSRRSPGV